MPGAPKQKPRRARSGRGKSNREVHITKETSETRPQAHPGEENDEDAETVRLSITLRAEREKTIRSARSGTNSL
jgi:hypothetical protein